MENGAAAAMGPARLNVFPSSVGDDSKNGLEALCGLGWRVETMTIRAAAVASLLAFALLLVSMPAASQSGDAAPPSPADRILYAHHEEDADEEYEGWMNTLEDDPDSDDVAMGESQDCTLPEPIPGVDSDVEATWTLTLGPELNESVFLRQNGSVFLKAYIGASGGDGENLTVNTTLRAGSVVVAHGENRTYNYTAADDGQYDTIEWEVPAQVTELHTGADLVWEIHLVGEACSVESGPFLGVSEERGRTAMMLPIVDTPPPVTYENLTGPDARISLTFDEPTDAVFVYNWTAENGTFEAAAASDLVNGTAFVEITAPDGEQQSLLLEGKQTTPGRSVTASGGTWQIRVTVEGAQGELAAGIREAAGSPGQGPGQGPPGDVGNQTSFPPDDDQASSGNGNESAQQQADEDGGGSPGLGTAVVLLGLVAAAVAYGARRPR